MGTGLVKFGTHLGQVWVNVGTSFGECWDNVETISGQVWGIPGERLTSLGKCGTVFGQV